MDQIMIEELLKNCQWYEKVIVKIFKKSLVKLYHYIRISVINSFLN